MSMLPGARLGPYEIVAPIGAGGMGEVFRARDTRLGRDVAIKVLPPGVAARPDRLHRFAQEARAAAALSHPNVLAVYDVHVEGGEIPYVVSELLEGETLLEALRRGPLPPRRAIELTVQVASGLAAAHAKGIVHRDVKPANIFITADGRAKVLDFGLARIVEMGDTDGESTTIGDNPVTHPGTVLGTVGYMAPEQVRGDVVDARADVFALGTVCYEMVAGRRAFTGETSVEVMAAIVRTDPAELPAETPQALGRVIRRCLEKLPAQRFQSATDVAFALEAISGTTAPSVAAALPPVAVTRPRFAVRPATAVAVLAGAVVGAGALWAVMQAVRPPPVEAVMYEAKSFDRLPVMNARFMPDGQTIVYSAATRGRGHAPALFVVSPTAEAPQRLDLGDVHLLSVSRSGELAVVMRARYLEQRLYSGTLARMTLGSSPRAVLDDVRQADWGPDGESLAIVHDLGDGRDRLEYPIGTALHEVSGYLSDPRVSPDGTRVAFVAHPWRFDDRGTVMVVERGGSARALTPELWSIEGLAWTADGQTVVFSGNAGGGGLMQPMGVPADAGAPLRTLLGVPGRLIVHDIARDGRWLAVREDLTFGVRARVPGADAERELSWLGSSGARSLSADGRQLLMVDVGQRSGAAYGIVLRATDGSETVRLGTGSPERLSPDGRWAAAILAQPIEVVIYPTGPGSPRRLAGGRFDTITSVQWFPDGQQVLVCGIEPKQQPRCFRTDLAGETFTPVADEGASVELAPDGRTALVTSGDGARRRSTLGTSDSRPVTALTAADRVVGWSRDSTAVFVQRGTEVPAVVERVDLSSGARTASRTLVPAGVDEAATVLVADWVGDGQWYAYNYTHSPSVLFVVTGVRP